MNTTPFPKIPDYCFSEEAQNLAQQEHFSSLTSARIKYLFNLFQIFSSYSNLLFGLNAKRRGALRDELQKLKENPSTTVSELGVLTKKIRQIKENNQYRKELEKQLNLPSFSAYESDDVAYLAFEVLGGISNYIQCAKKEIQENLKKNRNRLPLKHFNQFILAAEEELKSQKEDLSHSMLLRLKAADSQCDITYDDIIYSSLELENNKRSQNGAERIKKIPARYHFKKSDFINFHQYIKENGNQETLNSLNQLSWVENKAVSLEEISKPKKEKSLLEFFMPGRRILQSAFRDVHHNIDIHLKIKKFDSMGDQPFVENTHEWEEIVSIDESLKREMERLISLRNKLIPIIHFHEKNRISCRLSQLSIFRERILKRKKHILEEVIDHIKPWIDAGQYHALDSAISLSGGGEIELLHIKQQLREKIYQEALNAFHSVAFNIPENADASFFKRFENYLPKEQADAIAFIRRFISGELFSDADMTIDTALKRFSILFDKPEPYLHYLISEHLEATLFSSQQPAYHFYLNYEKQFGKVSNHSEQIKMKEKHHSEIAKQYFSELIESPKNEEVNINGSVYLNNQATHDTMIKYLFSTDRLQLSLINKIHSSNPEAVGDIGYIVSMIGHKNTQLMWRSHIDRARLELFISVIFCHNNHEKSFSELSQSLNNFPHIPFPGTKYVHKILADLMQHLPFTDWKETQHNVCNLLNSAQLSNQYRLQLLSKVLKNERFAEQHISKAPRYEDISYGNIRDLEEIYKTAIKKILSKTVITNRIAADFILKDFIAYNLIAIEFPDLKTELECLIQRCLEEDNAQYTISCIREELIANRIPAALARLKFIQNNLNLYQDHTLLYKLYKKTKQDWILLFFSMVEFFKKEYLSKNDSLLDAISVFFQAMHLGPDTEEDSGTPTPYQLASLQKISKHWRTIPCIERDADHHIIALFTDPMEETEKITMLIGAFSLGLLQESSVSRILIFIRRILDNYFPSIVIFEEQQSFLLALERYFKHEGTEEDQNTITNYLERPELRSAHSVIVNGPGPLPLQESDLLTLPPQKIIKLLSEHLRGLLQSESEQAHYLESFSQLSKLSEQLPDLAIYHRIKRLCVAGPRIVQLLNELPGAIIELATAKTATTEIINPLLFDIITADLITHEQKNLFIQLIDSALINIDSATVSSPATEKDLLITLKQSLQPSLFNTAHSTETPAPTHGSVNQSYYDSPAPLFKPTKTPESTDCPHQGVDTSGISMT